MNSIPSANVLPPIADTLADVGEGVAAMPDVHWGTGATVGSVIATQGAVIPAAVGVDIGCGMIAVDLGLKADVLRANSASIRKAIEALVPVGFNMHQTPLDEAEAWAAGMTTRRNGSVTRTRRTNSLGHLAAGIIS